ncbi:ArsR/SmtB family transcription factor [Fidelibacter multiformis]|uniref:ArsR/SmtB family transcription factor n=1 Tax=Fidelibacter multiformis TaxID=3377529 RepID=UPI0037DD7AC4
MAGIFKALGDPGRLQIVRLLRTGELCAGEIAQILHTDQSTLSHQLKILKFHGIVLSRKDGKYHRYSLDNACVRELLDLMDQHLVNC